MGKMSNCRGGGWERGDNERSWYEKGIGKKIVGKGRGSTQEDKEHGGGGSGDEAGTMNTE